MKYFYEKVIAEIIVYNFSEFPNSVHSILKF